MTSSLVHFAVSNSGLALGIAMIAWIVQRSGNWPQVAYALWLLVLAKLITPPIISTPVSIGLEMFSGGEMMIVDPVARDLSSPWLASSGFEAGMTAPAGDGVPTVAGPAFTDAVVPTLLLVWGVGSVIVLVSSLVHIRSFHRLLRNASLLAEPELQNIAFQISARLGLRATPRIRVTSANIAPLVWWVGGNVCVVLPARVTKELSAEQLYWILAHELSHVRRKDHLVRYIELLAHILFWWSPIEWWARRNMRANEEICCDALVLESHGAHPRRYARALIAAIESLARSSLQAPAIASELSSIRSNERRMKMIISHHTISKPRSRVSAWLLSTCFILPVGVTQAQDIDPATEPGFTSFGAPQIGDWTASSEDAKAVTGNIRIAESAIEFADGGRIEISPVYPDGRNVFAINPESDFTSLDDARLCGSPVTYVMLLSYHDYSLAMHLYDRSQPPEEPNSANVLDFARRGKCASYYYRTGS